MNSCETNSLTATPWANLFEPATRSASDAISRWTRRRMELTLAEVRELTLDELGGELPDRAGPSTIVTVAIAGDLSGQMILLFDDTQARYLAETLLNRKHEETESWHELELSALQETGNVFGSAFLNAIASLTGQKFLLPSPPTVMQEFAASVIEQAVMLQLTESDNVLYCRTGMLRDGESVDFMALFVPSTELLEQLRQAIHAQLMN